MESSPDNPHWTYRATAKSLDILAKTPLWGVTMSGQENITDEGGQILAFSHHNSWDIQALGVAVYRHNERPVHFMTKEELINTPLIGDFFKRNYGLPINRDKPKIEQLQAAVKTLEAGGILGVAPEGGRIRTGEVPEKLRGGVGFFATRASVEVIPVGIAGKNLEWPGGKYLPRPMHVHFGEPIAPRGTSRLDRKEIDEQLRPALVNALNLARHFHPDSL